MRRRVVFGLLAMLTIGPAVAQQGLVEDCEIESFSYGERNGRLFIEGDATCSEARMELMVFDDTTGNRIASDFTYIMDGRFELHLDAPVPEAIVLEYAIE